MRVVLLVVACVVCYGLFLGGAFAKAQKEKGTKPKPNDVIQVQVTGRLDGPPLVFGDAKEKYSGSVYAGGRKLLLDCAGNKAAEELLRQANAERSKHTGY